MAHEWMDRLSEYLDGELGERDRGALEAHLEGCAECADTLAALRAVAARAARAPGIAPAADLWPGIAARLKPRRSPLRLPSFFSPGWRLSVSAPQLAAAALALVLLSSGTVWLVLARRPAPLPVAPAITRTGPDATVAEFGFARYDAAIAELERTLSAHRRQLDPATVRVVEDNLATIDRAIAQARAALAADPSNPYLNDHVADQMRRKVDLLRQVTALIHA
ncbi:MAG TPA: zf-HC2 domain-containing protein [Candidatus Eisenbacteria bacterium]